MDGYFWCGSWLTLNIGTTLLNKTIFKYYSFPYPVMLSLIHMVFTAIFSFLAIVLFNYPRTKLDTAKHVKVGLDFGFSL
jgi:uncharacterized membrane protein AbrB (regulator of aidB expression)